jgi:hypothetical protein
MVRLNVVTPIFTGTPQMMEKGAEKALKKQGT